MGIDACMYFTTSEKLSKKEVQQLAYRMGATLGAGNFLCNGRRQCLEIIKTYRQDGPDVKAMPGETMVEVHLYSRYWGPGYERGDLPFILMVAVWIEQNVKNARVYYGGDSSGVLAELFDYNEREKYMRHFCSTNGFDYRKGIGSLTNDDDDIKQPTCETCDVPMDRYGWGNQYAAYHCLGCGLKQITRDGGKTFSEKEEA